MVPQDSHIILRTRHTLTRGHIANALRTCNQCEEQPDLSCLCLLRRDKAEAAPVLSKNAPKRIQLSALRAAAVRWSIPEFGWHI